jgi:hypothetical protein
MKRLATLAACLLILSPTLHAEDEKIPQITTLKGVIYKDVRVTRTQGDTVTIMHSDGVKKLQFSEMDEANGKLLGLEAYQKKNAEVEAIKQARLDAEKQKNAAENQKKQWLKERRQIAIKDLESNKKKTVIDWYDLYIFQDLRWESQVENYILGKNYTEASDLKKLQDLKKLFGRPADFQSGNSLSWNKVCWNPNTEKFDDIWVDKEEYKRLDGSQTFNEFVFRCGDKKYAVMDAPLRIGFSEAMWSKAKLGE